jgi:anti-anti-sigma factor
VSEDPVTIARCDDHVRAAVHGEFDMAATFAVEPVLDDVLGSGVERITLDLSDLSFIDSTGIAVVLRLEEETRNRGIELVIVRGPDTVHRVFETAGLADALPFATEAAGEP